MIRALASLFIVVAFAGCGGGAVTPLERPEPLTPVERPRLHVDLRWSEQVGTGVGDHYLRLAPLVDVDRVYAADRRGRVEALALESGRVVWDVDIGTRITAGPGDGGNAILFGSGADVVAVSKKDGEVLWREQAGSEVLAPPLRVGQVVIVRGVDGTVAGHALVDGRPLWDYSGEVPLLTLRGISEPVEADGSVVAGMANGSAVALDPVSGRVVWEATVSAPRGRTDLERMVDIDASPAVDGGTVYLSAYQGRLAAVSAASGQIRWSREISSHAGLTVADGTVYVVDSASDVWALSGQDGATLWKQEGLHGRRLSAPTVQGDYLVVGDYEGYLHWMVRESGRIVARTRVQESAPFNPLDDENSYELPFDESNAVAARPVLWQKGVVALDQRGLLNLFEVRPRER